jgi:hypothetical protein
MSDIALDADLFEKPVSNLVDLGRLLRKRCTEALDQETDATKKVESVKVGKISVNPKTLIETESLLRPLGKLISEDAKDRQNWMLILMLLGGLRRTASCLWVFGNTGWDLGSRLRPTRVWT